MHHPVVCGVYCLFKDRELVYVGKSRSVYVRIDEHRVKGRVFDYATVMACPEGDMGWVEEAMIAALQPVQNRSGKAQKVIHQTVVHQAAPDQSHRIYSRSQALQVVAEYGLSGMTFLSAVKDGSLPSHPKGGKERPSVPRLTRHPDLIAWCVRTQADMLSRVA